MKIEINLIDDNPYQTRDDFEHVEALADNIKANGLINPVILRPVSSRYELLCGECRLRACKMLGLTTVESEVKELSDNDARMVSFIDNEKRKKLKPVARAKAIYGIFTVMYTNDKSRTGNINVISPGSSEIIKLLRKTHDKIISPNKYINASLTDSEENLKILCNKIGLKFTQIIESLNLLNLPDELQTDKYGRSQQDLNSVVRVKKHFDTRISKAKLTEEKSGDINHIQSKKLIVDSERIEKKLIEKTIDKTYEPGLIKKMSDAIIKAPDELKLEVVNTDDHIKNRNISEVILKVNSEKDINDEDKEDIMEKMINDYTVNTNDKIDEFVNQFKELPHDLKEGVKDGLALEAAKQIWIEKDTSKRIEMIDRVINKPKTKQISITKPSNRPKVSEVMTNQKYRIIKELYDVSIINAKLFKTYPKEYKNEIIESMENTIDKLTDKIKEINEYNESKN